MKKNVGKNSSLINLFMEININLKSLMVQNILLLFLKKFYYVSSKMFFIHKKSKKINRNAERKMSWDCHMDLIFLYIFLKGLYIIPSVSFTYFSSDFKNCFNSNNSLFSLWMTDWRCGLHETMQDKTMFKWRVYR